MKSSNISKVIPIIFYDPIYQKILIYDEVIKELIYTKEFQRLRHIKQLGSMWLLLNSVNHTRFSHSLGVNFLINKLFKQEQFKELLSTCLNEKLELQVAGLLHDLGHGPLSHLFEKIVKNFQHEKYTVDIIKNPEGEIYPILKKYQLNIERICQLILGKTENDWGQSLISNQFDLDRLDYLLRDHYYLGLLSNGVNLNRLLDNILIKNKQLSFRKKVVIDLEQFLIFRYYMHKNFYWNQKNIFLDQLIINIFKRLKALAKNKLINFKLGYYEEIIFEKKINFQQLLNLNDNNLSVFLEKAYQKTNDKTLKKLLELLLYPKQEIQFKENFEEQDLQNLTKNGYEKNFFIIEATMNLTLYNKNQNEILIWEKKQKKLKSFSKVSMFFNETKKCQKIFKLLCLIN